MPKITKFEGKNVITAKTKSDPDPQLRDFDWWNKQGKSELCNSLFGVINHLKKNQGWRQHLAGRFARLYDNMPVMNYLGMNMSSLNSQYRNINERPTYNLIQSCIDAQISRLVQSKPKPLFITDGGDYKKRTIAKMLNKFIEGEFYQTDAYWMREQKLRDADIFGDGFTQILETENKRVGLERVICTQIYVDLQEAYWGEPRQLHKIKIVPREVLAAQYSNKASAVMTAGESFIDQSMENRNSVVSMVGVAESWHLKSGENAKDGRHVIAIDNEVLVDEDYEEEDFPFIKFPYSPRRAGYWSQGLAEQLQGLQSDINRKLYTAQQIWHLCGVPKWLVEDGSKVVAAHINNQIGGILKYQGTKPELQIFAVMPPGLLESIQTDIQMGYQQSGISAMSAASQKPAGLDSGAALREYDDLQTDRFAYLSQRDELSMLDLAKKMYEKAKHIARKYGKYETIYPGKNSIYKVEFPKELLSGDDDFVLQSFPVSAYSKSPPERKQQIIDDMQAGLIAPKEGMRLLDFPDLGQQQELANAPEERILKVLDEIVEEAKYTPPDSTFDIASAKTLVVQYINKYAMTNLEQERMDLLSAFSTQLDALQMAAMPPPQAMQPQANPMPAPTSPMLPNAPGVAA